MNDLNFMSDQQVELVQEFYESLYDNQQAYLKQCHELVITDGEPI